MRQLNCSDVKLEYLKSPSQISDEDIKNIDIKSGHSRKRQFLIACCISFLCAAVYSLFYAPKMFICCFMFIAFMLAQLIPCLRHRKIFACRAVVTGKKERWAKVSGRNDPAVMPYCETESADKTKCRTHLFYSLKSYYFCSVDINGEIFENVCCYEKDFDKIKSGNTVVIGVNTGVPVVYAIDNKQKGTER